jgi:hypothetical protein
MSLVLFLLVIALYVGVQAFVVWKVFPSVELVTLVIAFLISDGMAFGGVVMNGFLPPIPLNAGDVWVFLIVALLGLVGTSAVAIKVTLDKQRLDWLPCILLAGIINLGLMIVLGGPLFYTALGVSDTLFK